MLNSIEIDVTGQIGSDVKVLKNKNGKSFAKVSIAVNKYYKVNDEAKQTTQWVTLVFNDALVEFVKDKLIKGDAIRAQGIPKPTAWIDEEGVAQSALEISVDKFNLLSSKAKKAEDHVEPKKA